MTGGTACGGGGGGGACESGGADAGMRIDDAGETIEIGPTSKGSVPTTSGNVRIKSIGPDDGLSGKVVGKVFARGGT
jgi:hypothetical protein